MAAVIPFLATYGTLIAGGVAAGSAIYQGAQQKEAADYQAKVDDINATKALQEGSAAEAAVRRRNALAMGEVRAAASDTGFSPGKGSLLNLQTKTAGELELDALNARYRGQMEAVGYQTNAGIARQSGRNARTSGFLNAAGYLAQTGSRYDRGTRIAG